LEGRNYIVMPIVVARVVVSGEEVAAMPEAATWNDFS
jgi:hypothetical protein